jgi:tRNA G10  N-methylase Trm11
MKGWMPDNPTDLFQFTSGNDQNGNWELTSSPKPTAQDKQVFGKFASVYASFSQIFALDALKNLARRPNDVVLDPYSGVGTTLAAANSLGLRSHGFDLSPFSVTLSKLRFSTAIQERRFLELIDNNTNTPKADFFSEVTTALFSKSDLYLLASLLPKVSRESGRDWLRSALENPDAIWTENAYVFFCTVVAANKSANVATGSNPVWIRKLLEGEPLAQSNLEVLAKQFFQKLRAIEINGNAPVPSVQLADARAMPIESDTIDIALFSPPYLNRLDYFVTNFPANMVLCDVADRDSERIRRDMIGSTKISRKGSSPYPIGKYCQSLLNEIWNHESKASRTYYYWNFVEYIRSTYEVSQELRRVIKQDGRGAIVIQDSFYKDIRVLTHQIIIESLLAQGFACEIVRRETVKGHMGRMSPTQLSYANEKTLYEYVIAFSYS